MSPILPLELVDLVIQHLLQSPSHTTSPELFSLIRPLSVACSAFRRLALHLFFRHVVLLQTDARKANSEWNRLFRLLVSLGNNAQRDCYAWIRSLRTTSRALIGPFQTAQLNILQLEALSIDFASEGLATLRFATRLLRDAPQTMTVLVLTSLPEINRELLQLCAQFPLLVRLRLSTTERLDMHCWNCFEESLSCTVHSPIPTDYVQVKHLATSFAKILQPLKFLAHLHLGIYLSDEMVLDNHIQHAEEPGVIAFGPEECLLCDELAEEVCVRELVAAIEFAQYLKALCTVGFSSFFDRAAEGNETTVYVLRASGRLRVRKTSWDQECA